MTRKPKIPLISTSSVWRNLLFQHMNEGSCCQNSLRPLYGTCINHWGKLEGSKYQAGLISSVDVVILIQIFILSWIFYQGLQMSVANSSDPDPRHFSVIKQEKLWLFLPPLCCVQSRQVQTTHVKGITLFFNIKDGMLWQSLFVYISDAILQSSIFVEIAVLKDTVHNLA